jgi:hypothetical protein
MERQKRGRHLRRALQFEPLSRPSVKFPTMTQ